MAASCTKRFADIPFAHRQHKHRGHCRLIHGHSWTFEFTFTGEADPQTDFVVDFGGALMKHIKEEIYETFDHALVLCADDPFSASSHDARIVRLPSASSEGIARYLFLRYAPQVAHGCNYRNVILESVTVWEDSRNSATVRAGEMLCPTDS